jgi:hypothetical protein
MKPMFMFSVSGHKICDFAMMAVFLSFQNVAAVAARRMHETAVPVVKFSAKSVQERGP